MSFLGMPTRALAVVPDRVPNEYRILYANGSDTYIEADRVEWGTNMVRFYLDSKGGYLLVSAQNVDLIDEIRQVDTDAEDR